MYKEGKFLCCKLILFENDIKTLKFKYFSTVRTNEYTGQKSTKNLYLEFLITYMGNIKTKFENGLQPKNK